MFGLAVLTVSTSGSQGKRDDSSGQAIKDILEGHDFQVVRYEIVSDDKDTISAKLAGVTSVFYNGANWQPHWLTKIFPGTELHPHQPDAVVDDFAELLALVKQTRA